MSFPTTFQPLYLAVEGLISGTLGSVYTASVGTFNQSKVWSTMKDREIGIAAIGTDDVYYLGELAEEKGYYQETYDTKTYPINFKVVLETNFSGTILNSSDRNIAQSILNTKMFKIRNILTNPGNLRQDGLGNSTGLASGMFIWKGWEPPKWIWSGTAYGQGVLNFYGIITLQKT